MSIKRRLRDWLGITDIANNQQIIFNEQSQLHAKLDQTFQRLGAVQGQIIAANRGMARLVAKLDPLFAGDEMSPARKAESDKITEAVIRKLIGEHLASRVPGDNA